MATGGFREYELYELDPSIQEDRSQDEVNIFQLVLNGYQVYKRVGGKATPENRRRNVPIFLTNSYVNFLKKTPVFWATHDIGLTFLFYQMDFIKLQTMGYAFAPLFGQTATLESDMFPGRLIKLGPNYSILTRPQDERKILQTKGNIEGAKSAQMLSAGLQGRMIKYPTSEARREAEEGYDSGEEYDANGKLVRFLKIHSQFQGNEHSHGVVIAFDEQKNRYTYMKGESPNTYSLYMIPGRDEVIEIDQGTLERFIPDHKHFLEFEHIGLAVLRATLDSIGEARVDGGKFRFAMVNDTILGYHRLLITTISTSRQLPDSQYEVQFLMADGSLQTTNVPAHILRDQATLATARPLEDVKKATLLAGGYRRWNETPAGSPERNPAKQRHRGAGSITFDPNLVDSRPETMTWEDYLPRILEINETLEARDPQGTGSWTIDTAAKREFLGKQYKRLAIFVIKNVLVQQQQANNPQLLQIKLQQSNELAELCHELRRSEVERRLRHLQRFDPEGSQVEIAELENELQNPQYFLSGEDIEELWQAGREVEALIRQEFNQYQALGFTEGPAMAKSRFLRDNVFHTRGLQIVYQKRVAQIHKHKSGMCGQNPCRH